VARRVSLCLIVRDEEELLPGCLSSAASFVDEVVVVDTGSTDGSREVAEHHGALVASHPWTDDFAAARNASLELARGDFVLILDADERLTEGGGEAVRRLVAGEAEDAPPTLYLARIDNLDAAGRPQGADRMARLWRRRAELRFSGRVHEQVGVGVEGLRHVADEDFVLVHLGYDEQLVAARGKRARNLALLEADLAERPGDVTVLFHLAREHYAAGGHAAALPLFRRVLAAGGAGLPLVLGSHLFAAECLRRLDRPGDAVTLARRGLDEAPDYGELWYVAAEAAREAGRPEQAVRWYGRARRRREGPARAAFSDESVARWRADAGLGEALCTLGRHEEGVELLERACRGAPEGAERVRVELRWLACCARAGSRDPAVYRRLADLLRASGQESAAVAAERVLARLRATSEG